MAERFKEMWLDGWVRGVRILLALLGCRFSFLALSLARIYITLVVVWLVACGIIQSLFVTRVVKRARLTPGLWKRLHGPGHRCLS